MAADSFLAWLARLDLLSVCVSTCLCGCSRATSSRADYYYYFGTLASLTEVAAAAEGSVSAGVAGIEPLPGDRIDIVSVGTCSALFDRTRCDRLSKPGTRGHEDTSGVAHNPARIIETA